MAQSSLTYTPPQKKGNFRKVAFLLGKSVLFSCSYANKGMRRWVSLYWLFMQIEKNVQINGRSLKGHEVEQHCLSCLFFVIFRVFLLLSAILLTKKGCPSISFTGDIKNKEGCDSIREIYDVPMKFASKLIQIHGGHVHLCHIHCDYMYSKSVQCFM